MQTEKLHSLIAKKNERLEVDTLREAETIINQIAYAQQQIADLQESIKQLREKLVALEVPQIDAAEILG